MAKVIGKQELCSTNLKFFKALQIIGGKTLFDRYSALENIIKNNIDKQYQDFISFPVKEGDQIIFHGKISKETIHIFSELQSNDLENYQKIKEDTLFHYNSKIEELKNSGKTTESEFLTDAIKYIDDRFVFCYDNRVVLGIWGMTLRDNVREDISVIRKNLTKKNKPESQIEEPHSTSKKSYSIRFNADEGGQLNGQSEFSKYDGEFVAESEVPKVEAQDGYEFIGWNENPNGYGVNGDKEFTAQFRKVPFVSTDPPENIPWWKRFWLWLTGMGCLKWLLWLLLALLFLLLFWWLFHSCDRLPVGGGALGDNDSTWVREDSSRGQNGGIYDPYNPYQPVPTPPGYEDVLPPEQGVLPPMEGDPEIIPGNPSIMANRLNVLMENADKSILDLAKAFKAKYPDEKYKVVYYDNVVKRMQIEMPKEERENLKQAIPDQFAPDFDLFVFDEALFEGRYMPNDPAYSDQNKSRYLNTIKAAQAWDITRGLDKITVAIVDNGFNLNHPELNSKVIQPYNVWLHSDEVFPLPVDHGTHVAGIALAIADNGKGISGIAPNCKFMPIQVADKNGLMTTTSVLDGILYALYQGADVINVSLGSQFSGLSQFPESAQQDLIRNHFKEEERLWREVMRIAASHNSTIVVAAGNNNVLAGIDALQRPELFITVSATDKNNTVNKASFSNYGQYSTISAPGVGIYSSIGKNDYQVMDGTSMAAPIVAGAVALMKSLNDTITTKQIICILQGTGIETQGDIGKLIQLDKALEKVKAGDEFDCTPTPSTGDVQVLLSWNNYNDLDLICTDPNGHSVFFKNRRVPSGGQLEIDMNVEYPDRENPIENIYWPAGGAPNGTYHVYLLYFKQHINIMETPYKITVKYGDKTKDYEGTVSREKEAVHIGSFTLGTPGNNPQSPDLPPVNDRRSQLEQERDRLKKELDRVNDELRRIGNYR